MVAPLVEAPVAPERDVLLARLRRANGWARMLVPLECAATVALAALCLDPSLMAAQPIQTAVAIGIAAASSLTGVLVLLARRRLPIDAVADGVRFGAYDRGALERLTRDVLSRAGIEAESLGVYVLRDKDPNAETVQLAGAPFTRALDAVYLNRAILHLLGPDELRSVLGHELGHARPYRLLWNRLTLLHVAFTVVAALAIYQAFSGNETMALIATVLGVLGIRFALALPAAGLGHTLEFLCDDFGATVAGPVASINGLLKINAEAELRGALLARALARHGDREDVSVADLVTAYEQALPFDTAEPEQVEREIDRMVQEQGERSRKASLGGFLRYLMSEDADDDPASAAEAVRADLRAFERLPRIDWVDEFLASGKRSLGEAEIARLVERLEAAPDHVLFRTPGDVSDRGSSHPTVRRRIVYLWKHRDVLQQLARSPRLVWGDRA